MTAVARRSVLRRRDLFPKHALALEGACTEAARKLVAKNPDPNLECDLVFSAIALPSREKWQRFCQRRLSCGAKLTEITAWMRMWVGRCDSERDAYHVDPFASTKKLGYVVLIVTHPN